MQGPRRPAAWRRRLALLAAAMALGGACSDGQGSGLGDLLAPGERMPEGMTLTSSAFDEGEAVPERFSCEGENLPPPLRWDGVPAGTGELALVVEDPDAPEEIFVHWLVVGIDPAADGTGPSGLPAGARELPGGSDNPTYIGPCPPNGDGPHRYVFQVYALAQPADLPDGTSPAQKVQAVRRAATAGGVLEATFER